jgi:deoxyribose-phosphate aldolase
LPVTKIVNILEGALVYMIDIQAVAEKLAAVLQDTPEHLEENGDQIRAQRHHGFMATEPWVAPKNAPLASLIDHTLLLPQAVETDILRLCKEAVVHKFPVVCVAPYWVPTAVEACSDAGIRVAAVVGFPLGIATGLIKAVEATDCVARGAREIDMVIQVGALRSGHYQAVFSELLSVTNAVGSRALIKVIIETAYFTEEQIVSACLLCKWAGTDYVKTSTGFGPAGASVAHVALMRTAVGEKMGVKAAGGVKDAKTVKAMVAGGASRIGTSRGPQIVAG